MTKANQDICQKLYPERRKAQGAHNILEAGGREIQPPPVEAYMLEYNDDKALQTFGGMNKGKSAGHSTDTTYVHHYQHIHSTVWTDGATGICPRG